MYDEKIFVGVANVEEDFCVTTTKKIKGTYFEFHFYSLWHCGVKSKL